MFLKDHLKDTYQKASLDKNNFVLENIINIWAHRFGVESLNELKVKNHDQINLKEERHEEKNQDQVNLELLDNDQFQEEIDFKPKEVKKSNVDESITKKSNDSIKTNREYIESEELPLPNINNLRKWINNNEKKAS